MYQHGVLRVSACAAILAGCAFAQQGSIRGEVKYPDSALVADSSLAVQLVNIQTRSIVERTSPTAGGSFEFDSVPDGQYEIDVVNSYGDVLRREYVTTSGAVSFVTLRLPEVKTERPVSGTISVETLQHQVPKKAEKEFERSEQELKAGHMEKSIAHLERAVEIDPAFMQAHNNLGSRYYSIKQYDKAIAEFRKAGALDPRSEMVQSNLAIALVSAQHYPDGEQAARRALELGHSRKACLALGISLAQQWRGTSEAIEHLMHAAPDFPKARLIMADLFVREGQPERAADQVKQYLAVSKGRDRESVTRWLAGLEQQKKTLAQARQP